MPRFLAPAGVYGPAIFPTSKPPVKGLGGSVSFVVEDNIRYLSSIDLRDPRPIAILLSPRRRFPGNVSADGVHRYTFDIKFSDIQAAD